MYRITYILTPLMKEKKKKKDGFAGLGNILVLKGNMLVEIWYVFLNNLTVKENHLLSRQMAKKTSFSYLWSLKFLQMTSYALGKTFLETSAYLQLHLHYISSYCRLNSSLFQYIVTNMSRPKCSIRSHENRA